MSKLLVALGIRSLANGGEHAAGELGVKGSQVQILSSRRETAGQRPFRRKSEAASLLPCSDGARSHQLMAAESRWTAKRVPSLETGLCRPPVTAPKCPSGHRDGMRWHAGREHVRGANVRLSVCRPTPLMPRALAAVLIARHAFLGSTAVPARCGQCRPC
jgi:hypothetical protein